MGANASKVKSLIDLADTVVLRDVADGAETTTATETAVPLHELDTAYWHNNEIPHGVMEIMIHVTNTVSSEGDETYNLALLVDDVSAMNDSPVTVWSQDIARGFTGVLYAYVDSQNIPKLDTDSSGTEKYMAVKATITGGNPPGITYGAYITKSRRA